jgi:hypothetical protein
MPVTHNTPTGPAGTCDICARPFGHYEGMIDCGICEAVHCDRCAAAASDRGDYSPDASFDEGCWRDCSTWRGCLRCRGLVCCHCDEPLGVCACPCGHPEGACLKPAKEAA